MSKLSIRFERVHCAKDTKFALENDFLARY